VPIQQCSSTYCIVTEIVQGELSRNDVGLAGYHKKRLQVDTVVAGGENLHQRWLPVHNFDRF